MTLDWNKHNGCIKIVGDRSQFKMTFLNRNKRIINLQLKELYKFELDEGDLILEKNVLRFFKNKQLEIIVYKHFEYSFFKQDNNYITDAEYFLNLMIEKYNFKIVK